MATVCNWTQAKKEATLIVGLLFFLSVQSLDSIMDCDLTTRSIKKVLVSTLDNLWEEGYFISCIQTFFSLPLQGPLSLLRHSHSVVNTAVYTGGYIFLLLISLCNTQVMIILVRVSCIHWRNMFAYCKCICKEKIQFKASIIINQWPSTHWRKIFFFMCQSLELYINIR